MNTQLTETETARGKPPTEAGILIESQVRATRRRAFVDISILGIVFWSTFWTLRIAGAEDIGVWTILVGVGADAMSGAINYFS
jgi:hypothetical protein